MNCLKRRFLLGPLAHQHDTLDDIRLIDDAAVLHVVGSRHVTQADFRALRDFRDVLDPQRRSRLLSQHSLLDVVHSAVEPERANVHLLHAPSTKLPPALMLLLESCCSSWPILNP